MNDKGHFRFPEYAARRAFETNIFPSCYSNPVSPSSFLRPTWSTHNTRDMRWGASAPSLLLKSAPPSRGGELDTTLHEAEVEFVPNGTSLVSATIDETALRIRGQTSKQGDRDSTFEGQIPPWWQARVKDSPWTSHSKLFMSEKKWKKIIRPHPKHASSWVCTESGNKAIRHNSAS